MAAERTNRLGEKLAAAVAGLTVTVVLDHALTRLRGTATTLLT